MTSDHEPTPTPDPEPPDPEPPDPRFSLAAERTFLAWQRTGLALVAVGLAGAEFLPSTPIGAPIALGVVLVVAGGIVSAGSYAHHRAVGRALDAAETIPDSHLPELLVGTTVLAAVVALLVVLLSLA